MRKEILFYYGTDTPALMDTVELADTFVILQDYHPLIQQGVYAEFFPLAEKFIYWNCCKIPRTLCTLSTEETKFAEYQAEWDCYVLDLTRPLHRELLIKRAVELTSYFGVQGLFVDDLDVWADTLPRQKALLEFISELESYIPQNIGYIFNRGFPFWSKKSERIRAVVVEDVGPGSGTRLPLAAQEWLFNTLQIHVSLMLHRNPEASIIFLEYEESDQSEVKHVDFIALEGTNSPLTRLFDTFQHIDSIAIITSLGRKLNVWPKRFRPVQNSLTFLNF